MGAWCLSVLASHRAFFLSYVAPTFWNLAIVAAALWAGHVFRNADADIAIWIAVGSLIGASLHLLVQLPSVWRLLGGLRPDLNVNSEAVTLALRGTGPLLLNRGSAQLLAFAEQVIASYLGERMVAALFTAQTLYFLPFMLFGVAVSTAELPEMSRSTLDDTWHATHVGQRLALANRRLAVLIIPSVVAFVFLGREIVALLFQTGRFTSADTDMVWLVLAGYSLNLWASSRSRVTIQAFFALRDQRTPLRATLVRAATGALFAWLLVVPARHAFGFSETWGAFALACSMSLGAVAELLVLHVAARERLGRIPRSAKLQFGAFLAAVCSALLSVVLLTVLDDQVSTVIRASCALVLFALSYVFIMSVAGVDEIRALRGKLRR
jgi:putative peptidoglycan lipid II flippase